MNGKAIRWSAVRTVGTAAVALSVAAVLAGCLESRSTVDSKVELTVPGGGVCYLLEVDQENGGGGSEGETFLCVPKDEWDKNRLGERWVDANGKKK